MFSLVKKAIHQIHQMTQAQVEASLAAEAREQAIIYVTRLFQEQAEARLQFKLEVKQTTRE